MRNKWSNWNLTIQCLKQHCKHENNYYLSRRMAWYLALKCILLIWLDRQYIKGDERYPDKVIVGVIEGGQYPSEWGTSYWYEGVVVGYGYLSNWWIAYDGDSSP